MRINLILVIMFVFQLVIISSCSTELECDEKLNGAQKMDVQINASKDGTVINSQEDYFKQIQSDDTLYINFDTHTLIGINTRSSGCDACFETKFQIKNDQKKFVYEVKTKRKGRCKMLTSSNNWILVEKLPQDYAVEFVSK